MNVTSTHEYRFKYLKSEQWQTVRIEALAKQGAQCQICASESTSNDAHHVWYPKNIWDTKADQLVILCRPCHDFVHAITPECKTSDEETGRACWLRFRNAIIAWRMEKLGLFKHAYKFPIRDDIIKALERVKQLSQPAAGSAKTKKTIGTEIRDLQHLLDALYFTKDDG
mgnify:CR=1 FL=1